MRLYRALAEDEPFGDRAIGQPGANECGDLALAPCEAGPIPWRALSG